MRFSLLHLSLSFCMGILTHHLIMIKSRKKNKANIRAGFVLCVRLKFTSLDARDQFLHHFKLLSDAVAGNEPQTLSFQIMQADNDSLSLLLFERFLNKQDAYLTVHKCSDQFKRVKSFLNDLGPQCQMEGQSYIEIESHGFIN